MCSQIWIMHTGTLHSYKTKPTHLSLWEEAIFARNMISAPGSTEMIGQLELACHCTEMMHTVLGLAYCICWFNVTFHWCPGREESCSWWAGDRIFLRYWSLWRFTCMKLWLLGLDTQDVFICDMVRCLQIFIALQVGYWYMWMNFNTQSMYCQCWSCNDKANLISTIWSYHGKKIWTYHAIWCFQISIIYY